jgi:hypothetical protein
MGLRTPIISHRSVYVPVENEAAESAVSVALFDLDGTPLPGLRQSPELPSHPASAAYCSDADTLFLAEAYSEDNVIVALDATSHECVWSTPLGSFRSITGLAVLECPTGSVVIASSFNEESIHVHRVSDGARLCSARGLVRPIFIATDPRSNRVFVSTEPGIAVFRWDAVSSTLLPEGLVASAGSGSNRPVAVVGREDCGGPYLVVGTQHASLIRIISLRTLELIHEFCVSERASVCGIAADPATGALLICDSAFEGGKAVRVIEWPLQPHEFRGEILPAHA